MRHEHLEVGIPDPGNVPAIGGAVIEDPEQVELGSLERQRAENFIGAGRVLDEQDPELGIGDPRPFRLAQTRL